MKKSYYFDGATKLSFKKLFNTSAGQDGAIYKSLVFRFDPVGNCRVYSLEGGELLDKFTLADKEYIYPHSNAVFFGTEYYSETDEFPILYSNVYNTYQKEENRREGTLLAYRINRKETDFSAELVGIIKIGFTQDKLWISENVKDIRPYGNFVLDRDSGILHAFVMKDETRKTAFFSFKLPAIRDGEATGYKNVRCVTLSKSDIIDSFEGEYINFMQGAACKDGYIYSVEGFDEASSAKPKMKVFDTKEKKLVFSADLADYSLNNEPELVELYNGKAYYADHPGDLYELEFLN